MDQKIYDRVASYAAMERVIAGHPPVRLVVAGASGRHVFSALREAERKGFITTLHIGDLKDIEKGAREANYGLADVRPVKDPEEIAALAVETVRKGEGDILMKGSVSTATLLKAVLSEKTLFNRNRLLSHLLLLEGPKGRILGISDGGLNIRPTVEEKRQILLNAVEVFHLLGRQRPKVAVLAAMEKANPRIPESMDAAELSRLSDSGAIPGCIVDGPLALDLAVNPEACLLKDYWGKVTGDADILLTHDISSANALGKGLILLGGWSGGGLIVGAGRPIALLSRSDSAAEKYKSLILAMVVYRRQNP